MYKKYLGWFGLFWLFGFLGVQIVFGSSLDTVPDITVPSNDFETQYEQTQDLYRASGLAIYFEERSLLWTETTKRRNDLFLKLPIVPKAELDQFQAGVFHLLELNPHDPFTLILAGNYHDYCRQKQTALWYYQKAYEAAPQLEAARLALADYYLYDWQPEKVKEILSQADGSAASLRKGAAFLQSGQFTLALGYFLQSTSLPSTWQVTRDKDLFRTYLALGEPQHAAALINPTYLQTPLAGTLFRELMGWSAWLTGNSKAALSQWQAGKKVSSDYKLWESQMEWLAPDSHISLANALKEFHDSDFDAAFKINQGQMLLEQGQWDLAYENYLSAIHHDHRSLIGYLGAASIQLLKRDYHEALDLCNQGLTINPNFGPLVKKKTEILGKMGQSSRAKGNSQTVKSASSINPKDALHFMLVQQAAKKDSILVQGDTKNLVGIWLSENGNYWKWYPWWGGPIDVDRPLQKVWVIPCGPGLSGQATYLQSSLSRVVQTIPVSVHDHQLQIDFPFPVQLVLIAQNHSIYVGEQIMAEHRIPLSNFEGIQSPIQVRWQNEAGFWGSFRLNWQMEALVSDISLSKSETPLQGSIRLDNSITRYRRIAIHLAIADGAFDDKAETRDLSVSVGEAGSMTQWIPFRPVIDYELSPGDGPKTIIGRFKDSEGHIQEVRLDIYLDSTPPQLTLLEEDAAINVPVFRSKWSANEEVTCWLRILSDQGTWRFVPVSANPDGTYTGNVSSQDGVYCQIVARDNAGNVTEIVDNTLNTKLRQAIPVGFEAERLPGNETNQVSSRWIVIKPLTSGLKWAVSNDLSWWSNWQQGDSGLTWRTDPGNGEHLVFIRYQTPDSSLVHCQVLPVTNALEAGK